MSFASLSDRTKIAILADEATITGFKLTGINGSEWSTQSTYGVFNYLHPIYEDTDEDELQTKFKMLMERKEIAIVLLGRKAKEILKEEIAKKIDMFPLILEIPEKSAEPSAAEIALMTRLRELTGSK
ncbi:V-type H+-transporting ATPase subunit F [Nematocida homosporus]|uniref:V-type H+-transporting ATPase subunit F n=1 Tax=Nematocida homosporus TaxID=1912981 RepID=UPI00221EF27B|nr:V-type H+-transporting ATPase subunit F [Nematocida homosporus]KAI5184275.1 V-type H+-transporting ATPase subunit F [Nematocida homosporus]